MSFTITALNSLPDVEHVVDKSDALKARALVRFKNGREFLVVWDAMAGRFEVIHRYRQRFETLQSEPLDDPESVMEYLKWMAAREVVSSYVFLDLGD